MPDRFLRTGKLTVLLTQTVLLRPTTSILIHRFRTGLFTFGQVLSPKCDTTKTKLPNAFTPRTTDAAALFSGRRTTESPPEPTSPSAHLGSCLLALAESKGPRYGVADFLDQGIPPGTGRQLLGPLAEICAHLASRSSAGTLRLK